VVLRTQCYRGFTDAMLSWFYGRNAIVVLRTLLRGFTDAITWFYGRYYVVLRTQALFKPTPVGHFKKCNKV